MLEQTTNSVWAVIADHYNDSEIIMLPEYDLFGKSLKSTWGRSIEENLPDLTIFLKLNSNVLIFKVTYLEEFLFFFKILATRQYDFAENTKSGRIRSRFEKQKS